MSEEIISLFMTLGNKAATQISTSGEGSVPSPEMDFSEVVYACPHSYIIGHFIEQPYMNARKHLSDLDSTPDLVDITESELKLIALDWSLKPKVKTYGRAQLRRRISLQGSGKSLFTYLTDKKVDYYQEIVKNLPLTVINIKV